MQKPLYSSPALHLTPETCVDVHADSKYVVLAHVGDRTTSELHLTAEEAMQLADYLTEGAAACLAAKES